MDISFLIVISMRSVWGRDHNVVCNIHNNYHVLAEKNRWKCGGRVGDLTRLRQRDLLRQREATRHSDRQLATDVSKQRQPVESAMKISLNGLVVKLMDGVRIDVINNWAICC
jgi:hypothetical protein